MCWALQHFRSLLLKVDDWSKFSFLGLHKWFYKGTGSDLWVTPIGKRHLLSCLAVKYVRLKHLFLMVEQLWRLFVIWTSSKRNKKHTKSERSCTSYAGLRGIVASQKESRAHLGQLASSSKAAVKTKLSHFILGYILGWEKECFCID